MEIKISNQSIKDNIARKRWKLAKTQQEIADSLGLDRTTYRLIESGKTQLLNPHLGKLAEELGTTVEELVLGEDAMEILREDEARYESSSATETEAKLKSKIAELKKEIDEKDKKIASQEEKIHSLEERLQDKIFIINYLTKKDKG